MEISCGIPPGPRAVEHALVAEALGYERVWLYDSPALYPDVWVSLAQIAEDLIVGAILLDDVDHVLERGIAARGSALVPAIEARHGGGRGARQPCGRQGGGG